MPEEGHPSYGGVVISEDEDEEEDDDEEEKAYGWYPGDKG